MDKYKIEKIAKKYIDNTNAIGYSNTLQKKISNGKVTEQDSIRIYVPYKIPKNQLPDRLILPECVDGVAVDVVEIGEVVALNEARRDLVRPLCSGISVGNWAITAGTLGVPSEKDGKLYIMSNAHVFTDDPSKEVSGEKRIVQPAKYDGGTLDNIVAEYVWHDRIYPNGTEPSTCIVAKGYAEIGNIISSLFNRKSKLRAYVDGYNYQDCSAAKLVDGINFDCTKTFDFDISKYNLIGRLFAGSNLCTIICKMKYQVNVGFKPVVPWKDEPTGSIVRKSGRTTFDTEGEISDMSATISVNYGNFSAKIRDVIITSDMSAGGDSGSDVWEKAE
jgi:hypothetical protein